ncbi:MAG: DNA-binding protein [Peptococcaceae bacterium]|nr:DNA-binding protein [Peptococcaceae bacterium]
MLSPSLEDYLEEIYRLSLSHEAVRVTDIAGKLQVKLPSVTKALRRLNDENYLTYRRYKEIILTDKGRRLGRFLLERNRIIQEFIDLLDVACDKEQEAEAMEHYLSLPTIRAIDHLVSFMREHPSWLEAFQAYRLQKEREDLVLEDGYGEEEPGT